METPPTDRRATARTVAALVLLTAPTYCLWRAFGLLFTLFGESPSAAEQAEAGRWILGAVVSSLLASAGGLALSGGRRGAQCGFGIGLLLGLLLAGALTATTERPADAPARSGTHCVEHSGGVATCPGG